MLSLARAFTMKKGRHDGIGRRHTTQFIGKYGRSIFGTCIGISKSCQACKARHRLDNVVKGGFGRVRSILSEPGCRDDDQVWIFAPQSFGVE